MVSPGDGYKFSWSPGTITHFYALNKALEDSNFPLLVNGINYGWSYSLWCNNSIGGYCENPKGTVDTLTAQVTLTDKNGAKLFENNYLYNTYTPDFVKVNYSVMFNERNPSELGYFRIVHSGKDEGFWAGWYGPTVKDIYANILYKPNPCLIDPLSEPSCPGYKEALHKQQCSLNALHSPDCPGYQQAFLNYQCSMNPLFNVSCPGYQQANFQQQCSINPLYNNGCNGYAEALRNKQINDSCSANPQSSPTCPGYRQPSISAITNNIPSIGLEDPVKVIITPQITSDPIVNQAIANTQTKVEELPKVEIPQTQRPTRQSTVTQQRREEERQRQQAARPQGSAQAVQPQRRNVEPTQQDMAMAMLSSSSNQEFSTYTQTQVPDVPFYKVEDIYKRATISDNARALRQLNQRSDRIHREMVDEQYR
jgi:hypothetical protein